MAGSERKILVGKILGAHGVKGDVRVRSFTEKPAALFSYKGLVDAHGCSLVLKRKGVVKDGFIASVKIEGYQWNDMDSPSPAKSKALLRKAKISLPLPLSGERGIISDRDGAEALKGVELYIERAALPSLKKRQYYEADLVGLMARDSVGKAYGSVVAVHNYGAGTFLEIQPDKGGSFMLPFNDDFVPVVDVKAGVLTIVVPDGWVDEK